MAILADLNPFATASGSAAYLDHLASSLVALGAEVRLLVMAGLAPWQLRIRIPERFLAPYAQVLVRGTVRLGTRFYAARPGHWLARPGKAPPAFATRPLWDLPPPPEAGLGWAAARLARDPPDLVIANYFNAAAAFPRLPPRLAKAILVHDVMALRAASLAAHGLAPDFEAAMIAREAAAFASADLCLAIKDAEAAWIREQGARAATFPFAVDIPAADLVAPRPPHAVFVGSDAEPNADALGWLLGAIWPLVGAARPDARLRVVGRVAGRWRGPAPAGVELVGFVPDLAAEYARARVALTPVRFGSGVKIKLIEGLAHGLPSVATSVGAEGLAPAPAEALRVADEPEGFARAVLRALDDPAPEAARAAARDFAARHHARGAVLEGLGAALVGIRRPKPA